jgi:hypothetical protein
MNHRQRVDRVQIQQADPHGGYRDGMTTQQETRTAQYARGRGHRVQVGASPSRIQTL